MGSGQFHLFSSYRRLWIYYRPIMMVLHFCLVSYFATLLHFSENNPVRLSLTQKLLINVPILSFFSWSCSCYFHQAWLVRLLRLSSHFPGGVAGRVSHACYTLSSISLQRGLLQKSSWFYWSLVCVSLIIWVVELERYSLCFV